MSELFIYSDDDSDDNFNEISFNNTQNNPNIDIQPYPIIPEDIDFSRYQENINSPWRQGSKGNKYRYESNAINILS